MAGYRIEFEVAWTPKKTEADCYDYIKRYYPNATYGQWGENSVGEPTKPCYADLEGEERGEVKCEIIKNAKKQKKEMI